MGRLRVSPTLFLDANVLFSAAYSAEGRSAALFVLARKKLCLLVTSRYAIEEAGRNLEHKRPGSLKNFQALLTGICVLIEADAERLDEAAATGLDKGDVPILGAAIGKADILVTGDRKHFGFLMGRTVHGIKVLSLAETLDFVLLK